LPLAPACLAKDCILTLTTSMGLANKIENDPVIAAANILMESGGNSFGFKFGQRAFLT